VSMSPDIMKMIRLAESSVKRGDLDSACYIFDGFWESSATEYFQLLKTGNLRNFHHQFVGRLIMRDALKDSLHQAGAFKLNLPYCSVEKNVEINISQEFVDWVNWYKRIDDQYRIDNLEKTYGGPVSSLAPSYIIEIVLSDLCDILPRISFDRECLLNIGSGSGLLDVMLRSCLPSFETTVLVELEESGRLASEALVKDNDLSNFYVLAPDDDIALHGPYDLILSCRAMCYLFSVQDYASVFKSNLRDDAEAFIDFRNNPWGESEKLEVLSWF
jgi:hypothetical protein